MREFLRQIQQQARHWLDAMAEELVRSENSGFGKAPERHQKSKWISPDEDVKKLIMSANSLNDIWQFLVQRLNTGSAPNFILFSVVDEVAELLRLKYLFPHRVDKPFEDEFIPICDHANHLVKTVLRSDTTFTHHLQELGREVYPYLPMTEDASAHVFSIPLIAGGRTIALMTLGFAELDSFTQAKLSYVYHLRDQLAHVVWNLILQERIQNQPQLDNLTNLMTYSSFHQALKKELRRAKLEDMRLSLVLVDINNLRTYNERYSHQMGDRAIALLSSIIKHQVRGIDTIARYGNDEIAVILPETDMPDALIVANRIIDAVQQPCKTVRPFTISVGLACYPQDAQDLEELTQLAENALQFGKHQSDEYQQSTVVSAQELGQATDQERLDVFAAQLAKKYGETGSDLFETIMRRMESNAQVEADNLMLETVASLAGAMDAKDKYTRGHSQSVANYAVALSHAVNLPPAEVERVRLAAFFHDIGKIGIPESILNKPGPLTEAEKEIMKQHPVIGARQILHPVTALRDIVPIVEYHHERWDGLGHPVGLKGENIPMGARIVSIVDAFHALTSNRPYRKALPLEEALTILQDGAGTLWDPQLVEKFFDLVRRAHCKTPLDKIAV